MATLKLPWISRRGMLQGAAAIAAGSTLPRVGAAAEEVNGEWTAKKAVMSRSARIIMEGNVHIPGDTF